MLGPTFVYPPDGVQAYQTLYGNSVSVPGDGSLVHLGLDNLGTGDALVNNSTPAAPFFIAGGVYAITVTLTRLGVTGPIWYAEILGADLDDPIFVSGEFTGTAASLSITVQVGSSRGFFVSVVNGDTGTPHNFQIQWAYIQRII